MPNDDEFSKKISELGLDDLLKIIGSLRAVLNKLDGSNDENGLIDQMLQANNLLEKSVLEIDGSTEGLKSVVELVNEFNKQFSGLSSELKEFGTTFEAHKSDIVEYISQMHNDLLMNEMGKFVEDVDKLFHKKVEVLEQERAGTKKHNFISLFIAALGLIFGSIGLSFALFYFFFYDDIRTAEIINTAPVKIMSVNKGVVFTAPSSHTNLTKSQNHINMAVAFKK